MHRVGTRFAALVAFVLLPAALAAPDLAEPKPPAPTLASFLRGASVGTRLPKEPLLTVWPAIEALWKGADLEVINVLEGAPLSPGVRLLVVAPRSGLPMHYGLLMQTEGRVEPIFCPLEASGQDTFAASLAKERAWTRLHEEAIAAPETLCARPADEVARLYAFLLTVSRYSEPWTVLLTEPELARRERVWQMEDFIPRLRTFLGEPAYRSYPFLGAGECVVTFRTWNWGSGSVEEWMGRLPAHHTSYFAKIPIGEGVTARRPQPTEHSIRPRGAPAAPVSPSPTDPSGRGGSP